MAVMWTVLMGENITNRPEGWILGLLLPILHVTVSDWQDGWEQSGHEGRWRILFGPWGLSHSQVWAGKMCQSYVAAMKLNFFDNIFPVSQLMEALGPASFGALITAAFLVLIFNLILFFILVRKFIKVAPVSQVDIHIILFSFNRCSGSQPPLGELPVLSHPPLYLHDPAPPQVHRVHPGLLQAL